MKIGDVELVFLSDGAFRLDGGAMFGIVPKPVWERRIAADERNRIRLALRPLLIRTPDAAILVDTGIGQKWDERSLDLFEIVPGVWATVTAGHTRAHQGAEVRQNGTKAFYFGDLIPTAAHLDPPWCMGYDCYPTETALTKARLVQQAVDERWVVLFDHDPDAPGGHVVKDGRKFRLEPLE